MKIIKYKRTKTFTISAIIDIYLGIALFYILYAFFVKGKTAYGFSPLIIVVMILVSFLPAISALYKLRVIFPIYIKMLNDGMVLYDGMIKKGKEIKYIDIIKVEVKEKFLMLEIKNENKEEEKLYIIKQLISEEDLNLIKNRLKENRVEIK